MGRGPARVGPARPHKSCGHPFALRGRNPSENGRSIIKKICCGLVSAFLPAKSNGYPTTDLHRANSPNPVTPPHKIYIHYLYDISVM